MTRKFLRKEFSDTTEDNYWAFTFWVLMTLLGGIISGLLIYFDQVFAAKLFDSSIAFIAGAIGFGVGLILLRDGKPRGLTLAVVLWAFMDCIMGLAIFIILLPHIFAPELPSTMLFSGYAIASYFFIGMWAWGSSLLSIYVALGTRHPRMFYGKAVLWPFSKD